jgi:universal stress protein E
MLVAPSKQSSVCLPVCSPRTAGAPIYFGVSADTVFVRGKGWLELIRQVLRGNHDLVFVGTGNFTGVRRMLLGNTALKLFRRCPCPVWVSRPGKYDWPLNLLVASDLQPVSETALRLAVCLGHTLDATVHVLHVIQSPPYHLAITALSLPAERFRDFHVNVAVRPIAMVKNAPRRRNRAEQVLHEQLARSGAASLAHPVQVHFLDSPEDRVDEAIRDRLRSNPPRIT